MRITKRFARKEASDNGFRSKFEFDFWKQLQALKLKADYETEKLKFTVPETIKTYTPDWVIGDKIYIETKGRFSAPDRKKILWVLKSNPDVTIYMLFQNSKVTLSKKSATTYAAWCDKNNIPWADIRDVRTWKSWFNTKELNEV